jgi:hypothetical protein
LPIRSIDKRSYNAFALMLITREELGCATTKYGTLASEETANTLLSPEVGHKRTLGLLLQ